MAELAARAAVLGFVALLAACGQAAEPANRTAGAAKAPEPATPEAAAVSIMLGCSIAETISRLEPAATALSIASALASVPPLVNTTVEAGAAIRAATSERACSSTACAARPAAWTDDGLPTRSRTAVTAAMASGRTRAVALWSR